MRNYLIILFFLSLLFVAFTQPASAQHPQEPETENYRQGITLFEKGLYERAAEELSAFINQYPDHTLTASASFYHMRALGEVNPGHRAAYYQRFIQTRPNSVFAQKLLFDLAHIAEEAENYKEALGYYQKAISHNITQNQGAKAYYWMAEASVKMRDLAEARGYFQQIFDEYPDTEWAPKALYSKGRLFLDEGQFSDASETFEVLKQHYPNTDITRRIGTALGESYYKQGRYEEALKALQESLAYLEGEQEQKAVLLIAESYSALGNLDQASSTYLRYINLTKGTPAERAAHYGLGWVYYKQEIYHWAAREFTSAAVGDDLIARKALYYKAVNEKFGDRYAEALRTFRTFGDKFKEGPWVEKAYYEWAMTAYEMERYAEAIQTLLFLIRSDEQLEWQGKVYTLLGQAYFANKEYTRALQAFNAAEQMTDIDPVVKRQARFQKGWLLFRNQAYEQAQDIFDNLHQQVPETEVGTKSLFWSADAYFNQQEYGSAASQFTEFIETYPDHRLTGAARYSLGWSYFKMGDYNRAIGPFVSFLNDYEPPEIALYPYNTDTRLRLADSYYALSDYNKAIETYQEIVGSDPGGDYALFQIANSYYRAEQNYQAVTTFRQLLRTHPNSRLKEQAQYNIAYIYLNSGNYEQAISELQTLISKYPGTSWAALAQYNIGDAYYNAGQYQNAIAAYQKVLQIYPNSDYVVEAANAIDYSKRAASSGAQAQNASPDTTSAIDTFIQNNPDAANTEKLRFQQARQLVQTGDYINAIERLEEFINTTDNEELLPQAYLSLALSYRETDRMPQAVETYRTVAQRFTGTDEAAEALIVLGRIRYNQGDYQGAIDYYNRVVSSDNGSQKLTAHTAWGNALLALDEIQAAREQYNAALRIDGSYGPAKIGLARTDLQQNNYEQARQTLTSVAATNTGAAGAEAQYLLGEVHVQLGNFKQAVDEFSKVRVLYEFYDNWVAKSLMGSAEAYIQLGNRGQAQKMLQELVEQYPQSAEAQRAQQMLDEVD